MRNLVYLLSFLMIMSTTFCIVTDFGELNSLHEKGEQDKGGERSSWVISPSSGPHFGGDNITLTGSDFSSFFPETDPWENFTIDSSADVGKFSSIVADSNGELHIAYRDATNGHLKYASNAGGTWTNYPIDNGGGYIGRYTSIDVDSNDLSLIHI